MDKAGIKHDPRNARKHNPRNVAMVEQSIQRDGFGRSILLANDGTVIAGNATIDAAASAGLDDVLVVETDGTKVIAVKRTDVAPGSEEFTRLAISDNRAAELASWDESVIAALNEEMDLSAFFGDDELAKLLASVTKDGLTDPDDVPTVTEATTKPGDLWLLGRHRVLCGDSTVATDVERLMGGAKADMVFTDPPYAIYGSSTGFENDSRMIQPFFRGVWRAISLSHAKDVYMCCDWRSYPTIHATCEPYAIKDVIVWDKASGGLGNPYRRRHEFVVFAREQSQRNTMMSKLKTPVRSITDDDVWQFVRAEGKTHNAEKPVELVGRAIANSSDPDDVVFDPFLGSGTTLIAAEQLNRTCYGMEIDPHYCDVIVKRWQDFTGQTATLESLAMAAD